MKKDADSTRQPHSYAYTSYGYANNVAEHENLLAFNGQHRDTSTGVYMLGNGHRCYNPTLQRFQSPDELSPFDAGGINAYAYCNGDPINMIDPSGQSAFSSLIKGILNALHLRKKGASKYPQHSASPARSETFLATNHRSEAPLSRSTPSLPAYTEDVPSGHTTQETSRAMTDEQAKVQSQKLDQKAKKYETAANQQWLFQVYGKQIKGEKVNARDLERIKKIRTAQKNLEDKARFIRNHKQQPPPKYRK
ncbi:RHS repeat-associated core domain-containing protein [Pseudomonas sp. NPDC089396]|uniref:RHS repeat-associated core domain-containing protein n=1 Tax=Pseudomonas sp. NPDC089396 TaxID=3364461 RepID=UPI003835E6B6